MKSFDSQQHYQRTCLHCRIELLIQCDAGTYQLQSGTNKTFTQDPGCGSSHCDVYQQPIVATIEVVSLLTKSQALILPPPHDSFLCLSSWL